VPDLIPKDHERAWVERCPRLRHNAIVHISAKGAQLSAQKSGADGCHDHIVTEYVVATALAKQRERCAKIVEGLDAMDLTYDFAPWDKSIDVVDWEQSRKDIADIIRRGDA
jgi:hypothetical protein